MKLSKYLADYIEHEKDMIGGAAVWENLLEIVQQGIEAFESTEAVEVLVVSEEEQKSESCYDCRYFRPNKDMRGYAPPPDICVIEPKAIARYTTIACRHFKALK